MRRYEIEYVNYDPDNDGGVWNVSDDEGQHVASFAHPSDADFFVLCRRSFPGLLEASETALNLAESNEYDSLPTYVELRAAIAKAKEA